MENDIWTSISIMSRPVLDTGSISTYIEPLLKFTKEEKKDKKISQS